MDALRFIYVITFVSFVSSEDVPGLCKNPIITAADRLPNNTYRVYRDDYFWELVGLPDPNVQVKGPYRVWYEHMKPVDKVSSVQTVVGGKADGLTWKFRGKKYWLYNSKDGSLIEGGKNGFDWSLFPAGDFNAVLNDGMLGGSRFPTMIAFSGIKVYYYKTDGREFRRIGSENGYTGGKDKEKFPGDLTAAFAFPSRDKSIKYFVYLFRRHQYCYRPYIGEDGCKQWLNNADLFGCNVSQNKTTVTVSGNPEVTQSKTKDDLQTRPATGPNEEQQSSRGTEQPSQEQSQEQAQSSGSAFLIVIIVVVIVVVAIVVGIVVFSMKREKSQSNKGPKGTPSKSNAGVTAKSSKKISSEA